MDTVDIIISYRLTFNFPPIIETLPNLFQSPEAMTVHFGSNTKSRLTARTRFSLAHTHGDILREGWKNILECILQLYKANLMPNSLYQVQLFLVMIIFEIILYL